MPKPVSAAVTLSAKYQLVIPKAIREAAQLKPGRQLQMFVVNNIIQLVPVMSVEDAGGFVKGVPNDFQRDKTDRL